MPSNKQPTAFTPAAIESRIHIVRGQRVMLDFQLAELYEVMTAALNQAVERNRERFPTDFAFQLTREELAALISQSVISKAGRGGRQKLPWVFTEQGVPMLSGVLRSVIAVRVNIEIMRAFVRLRRLLATPGEILVVLKQISETVELHDKQIKSIAEVLRKLMEPPKTEPLKRRIGFINTDNETAPEDQK